MARSRNALPAPGGLFESTGNRARQLASGNPGSAGFNDRTATDFSAGIAGLSAIVEGIQLQRDSVKAVGLETEATVAMQAEMAALNPLDKDYQAQVKSVTDNAKRKVMDGGITSTAVADDLSKRMDRHSAAMQIAAVGETKSAVNKQAQLTYTDAKEAINAKIRNDPANANLYMGEFQADVERLKVGMDPVAFEVVSRGAADDFAKNQVIGYAEKGNMGAARNALKAQAPHLKTEVVTGLSSYIDGKESKARADGDRARTANASTLLLDIEDQFNGRKPIDPNMRERLDDMKNKGMISPEHHLMAVKTWNNENQKYLVEGQKNAAAAKHLADNTIPSQEVADRAFRNQFGGNIPFGAIAQSGTPEQKAAAIVLATGMATSAGGYLPSDMKNMIVNADRTTDPKRSATVAYAAEAMDEMEAKGVTKLAGVTLEDTGVVNRTRAAAKRLIADGTPRQEAYAQAAQTEMPKDKITSQQENDLRELTKVDFSQKKIDPAAQALAAAAPGFTEKYVPFMAPDTAPAMGAEWKRVYEEAFVVTNGNKERAKALADKKISETYGATKVGVTDARQFKPSADPAATTAGPYAATYAGAGSTTDGMVGGGRDTVQKFPPERYMPFPNLSNEQKAKVIMAELDAFNKKLGIAPSPDKDLTGAPVVRLFPDAQTAEDIRQGRAPSYQYHVLKGTLYEPIPTANGPVRYRVPSNPDQLKDNPAYQAAEKTRIDDFNKKQALEIELGTKVPDAPADERARRMREEGRKLKQRADDGEGSVAGTVKEIGKAKNLDRLMEEINKGPLSKNVIIEGGSILFSDPAYMQGGKATPVTEGPPKEFDLPSVGELKQIMKDQDLRGNAKAIVQRALDAAEERRRKAKKD